jgi:hypothetical protein
MNHMKQIFISILYFIVHSQAIGQYVYFNNQYLYEEIRNIVPFASYQTNYKYYTYTHTVNAMNLDVNSILLFDLNGVLLDYSDHLIGDESTFSPGNGDVSDVVLQLNDSTIVGTLSGRTNNSCGTSLRTLGLGKFNGLELTWFQQYPELIDCTNNEEYLGPNLTYINDTCFLLSSKLLSGEFGELSGRAFTYFNYDGEVIAHYPHFGTQSLNDSYFKIDKHTNYFIGNGIAVGTQGNVLSKFDQEGNRIDSLHFGNPNLGYAGANTGQFIGDHLYMFIYAFVQDYTQFGNPVQFDTRVALINTETMTIISDELLAIPSNDLSIFEGGITTSMRTTNNEVLFTVNTIEFSSFDCNLSIFKLDMNGNIIWSNSYSPPVEVARYGIANIIEAPDLGYLCTGGTLHDEGLTRQKPWLLKLDACGYEEPSDCPPVVGVADMEATPSVQVWPNPFRTNLKALLPAQTKTVNWLDATGRLVHQDNVYYPNQEWNLRHLPIGLYHMQIELSDGRTISQKVVKE